MDRIQVWQFKLRPILRHEINSHKFLFQQDQKSLWIVVGDTRASGASVTSGWLLLNARLVYGKELDDFGCEIKANVRVFALNDTNCDLVRVVDIRLRISQMVDRYGKF